ncbi:MAG: glycosyltransferase family 4 protein [Chloroflexi bacterium]|nr:glycosyltransferase family 4 protein [Chloroflexota bacterium]
MIRAAFYQSSPQHLYGGQLDLLRYLETCDRSLVQPHVIAPAAGPFVERASELDVPVTVLPLPALLAQTGGALLHGGPLARMHQLALLLPWSLRLARLLRALRADVLYANNRRAVLTTGLAAKWARVPLFWHIKQDRDRGRMDALAFRLTTYAAACSRDVQRAFQLRHPDRASRIGYAPYGIPLASFSAQGPDLRGRLGLSEAASVVGLAGSIHPRKGADLFVQAALRLAPRHPLVHFVLAGDAPEAFLDFKREVLAAAEPLMGSGRFHVLGWLSDMAAFYRTLDVLCLPSRVEGFGLVVAEAAAAGVPVVRTATAGHSETTIDGETGFVVPIDDVDALTERLDLLLGDPALRERMGRCARLYAQAHFSLERFVSALTEALYIAADAFRSNDISRT